MTALAPSSVILGRFARLAAAGLVPLLVAAIPGAVLTERTAGVEVRSAILIGCAVGLLGNWFGTVPVTLVHDLAGRSAGLAALAGTALRFLAVLMLAAPVVLSGRVAPTVFVVWVAISYVVVLCGETVMLVILTNHAKRAKQP